jgi:hypothetical protein
MSVVARILMIVFSYVLACIAGAALVTFGLLALDWDNLSQAGLLSVAIVVIIIVAATIMGVVGALPTALIVVIAEAFAWRSVLFYAAAGGALALALSYGFGLPSGIDDIVQPGVYLAQERQLLAASGIAGGLVYWLFAGRRAGSWRSGSWK